MFYPTINQKPGAAQAYASALRVHQLADGNEKTVFDVYEGYWSPIDKNHTTVRSMLSWMLKCTFVPLSTAARLPAGFAKILFDALYTAIAVVSMLVLGGVALTAAFFTYTWLTQLGADHAVSAGDLFKALASAPLDLITGLRPWVISAVVLSIVGAYSLAQLFVSASAQNTPAAKAAIRTPKAKRRGYYKWRMSAQIILLLVGLASIAVSCAIVVTTKWWMHAVPLGFVLAGASLRGYLAFANDFFINRLGDVQIYTTRDNNSAYYGLRAQILETVQKTVQQVLDTTVDPKPDRDDSALAEGSLGQMEGAVEQSVDGERTPAEDGRRKDAGLYDRVYILAHSLGSTIAMDVLIRLHQLVEGGTLPIEDWRRIRGFATFGTALEKSKFFFDMQNPTLSESYDQWRNSVDAHVFSGDCRDLYRAQQTSMDSDRIPIFWANYWYEHDIVANEIITYRDAETKSEMDDRLICQNAKLADRFPRRLWVHSDYLTDENFWSGVCHDGKQVTGILAMLTSGDTITTRIGTCDTSGRSARSGQAARGIVRDDSVAGKGNR